MGEYITDTFGTMTAASRVAEDRHQFRRDIWATTCSEKKKCIYFVMVLAVSHIYFPVKGVILANGAYNVLFVWIIIWSEWVTT